MNVETWREQVRALLASHRPAEGRGSVVPLRLGGANDAAVLAELLRRVAANPALSQACANGLLCFELHIDPTALANALSVPAPACACKSQPTPAPDPIPPEARSTPLLCGVVTERDVRCLPAVCRTAGLAPGALLTPLARDALRERGIAILKPNPDHHI